MKITLLIELLQAVCSQNGSNSEVLCELKHLGSGDYYIAEINGIRFAEGTKSVTLIGETKD